MKKGIYNCFGKPLAIDSKTEVRNPDWINKETGYPDFDKYMQHGDGEGFDIDKICEESGYYKTRTILPTGKLIARFGSPSGRFTSEIGSSYDSLSLPYVQETVEYHEYEVCEPIDVDCYVRVDQGYVAPCFDCDGGAIQYYHFADTIRDLVQKKALKEDYTWLTKHKSIHS